jgi:hypothetical protein
MFGMFRFLSYLYSIKQQQGGNLTFRTSPMKRYIIKLTTDQPTQGRVACLQPGTCINAFVTEVLEIPQSDILSITELKN